MTAAVLGNGVYSFHSDGASRSWSKHKPQLPTDSLYPEDVELLRSLDLGPEVAFLSELTSLTHGSDDDDGGTDRAGTAVDAGQLLSKRKMLAAYPGSSRVLAQYRLFYNGRGLQRLGRILTGATAKTDLLKDVLASTLEDALLATACHFLPRERGVLILDEQAEGTLKVAIAERLPRVEDFDAYAISSHLIADLKASLGAVNALTIDGGSVFVNNGKLYVVILKSPAAAARRD